MIPDIVHALWIGDTLSDLELTSINSFLKNNYEYHLYLYQPLQTIVPSDVIIEDANKIIPEKDIFRYQNGSPSAFSNLFRFEVIFQKGGYWVDLDLICVKKFTPLPNQDIVIVSEAETETKISATSFLIGGNKNCSKIKWARDFCLKLKPDVISGKMQWGMGPLTMQSFQKQFNIHIPSWKMGTICNCHQFKALLDPNYCHSKKTYLTHVSDIGKETYFIHLWNEMWRRHGINKNSDFHPDSIYMFFKRKYLLS